tara:strand:- start:79743 stop:80735 length:993 start_codon:yes stop_codon:yes gene_type:complete
MINSKKMRLTMFAASMVAAAALTGCFDDKSADAGPSSTSFNNGAALGALVGATCTYASNSGADLISENAPVVTNSLGAAPVNILNLVAGDFPIIISCENGSYFDEANPGAGLVSNEGNTIQSIIPSAAALAQVGNNVGVNTLTDMATKLYKSAAAEDQTVDGAVAAFSEVGRVMMKGFMANGGALNLLGSSTPVTDDAPALADDTAGQLAVYLAALAQVAKDMNTIPATTPAALGKLLADAMTNGTDVNSVVPLKNGENFVQQLKRAANNYAIANSGSTNLGASVSGQLAGEGGSASKPKGTGGNDGTGSGGNPSGGTGGVGITGSGGTL